MRFFKNNAETRFTVALRGQVSVDLDSKVSIPGGKHLATSFDTVPDVPITSFTLHLVSGAQHGPIGVADDLCLPRNRKAKAQIDFHAQNGDLIQRAQALKVVGCGSARSKRSHKRH